MKAIFLMFHGFSQYSGITKKVHYQNKAFIQNGIESDICYLFIDQNNNHKRMLGNKLIDNFGHGTLAKLRKRFCYKKLKDYLVQNNYSFVYIRTFHNANIFLIQFIKQLHKAGIQVLMEIPTYPYDHEHKNAGKADQLKHLSDCIFRKQLARQLDYIVTFSNEDRIFGTQTIRISNGIDFDEIPLRSPHPIQPEQFRIVAVAEIHYWHGYDRLIRGIYDYKKQNSTNQIIFDLIGYGEDKDIQPLLDLIKELNLKENVFFHGPKFGNDLDYYFDQADLAAASLARHRSAISSIKTLKNREYAGRGIPFFYSEDDDDFDQMPYVYKVPANDSPINIQKLIKFTESIGLSPQQIRDSINPQLSWKEQMKHVVDQLKKSFHENN